MNNTNNKIKGDPFWSENISVLFYTNRLTNFFPSSSMSMTEKLNAITRFSIYISLLIYFYNQDYRFLFIMCIGFIGTYLLYNNSNKEQFENYICDINKNIKCTKSTTENPFKNVLINEMGANKNREKACKNDEKEVNENFYNNLYRDISDVYESKHSQRQFYTNPVTELTNDQVGFANWLYNKPSCKSGDKEQCVKNIKNRHVQR